MIQSELFLITSMFTWTVFSWGVYVFVINFCLDFALTLIFMTVADWLHHYIQSMMKLSLTLFIF